MQNIYSKLIILALTLKQTTSVEILHIGYYPKAPN
jgi:hypothetical protein